MKNNFFYCYSTKLRDYLKKNGMPFLLTAKAVSNDRQFWLYNFHEVEPLIKKYGAKKYGNK